MEKQTSIGKVNGTEIFAVSSGSGEILVPIKPICTALGVAFEPQFTKIKNDPSFSPTITIIVTVGADGKDREMVCLPHRRVYGWLYTINPGKVAPEARESVMKYRDTCNDILYDHFFRRSDKLRELDQAERQAMARLEILDSKLKQAQEVVSGIKAEQADTRKNIDKIRTARLDDQPTLF